MKYNYPSRKIIEVKARFEDIFKLVDQKKSIPLKQLAKILGSISSMVQSHGSIVMVMSRRTQHLVGKFVYLKGSESSICIDSQAVNELKFIYENLEKLNGTSIFTYKYPVKILGSIIL